MFSTNFCRVRISHKKQLLLQLESVLLKIFNTLIVSKHSLHSDPASILSTIIRGIVILLLLYFFSNTQNTHRNVHCGIAADRAHGSHHLVHAQLATIRVTNSGCTMLIYFLFLSFRFNGVAKRRKRTHPGGGITSDSSAPVDSNWLDLIKIRLRRGIGAPPRDKLRSGIGTRSLFWQLR